MRTYFPSRSPCPIGRASRVLGDRWIILIIREAFLGVDRFDDLLDRLQISRATLSSRLEWLIEAGVLARVPPAAKYARYELTEGGQALGPLLHALRDWGDEWVPQSTSKRS